MKVFGLNIGGAADGGPALVVGGHPAVDLLPREVRDARKSQGTRRGIIALAVLAIVAAVGGGGAATYASIVADARLATEEGRTEALLARQTEFVDVTTIQRQIEERTAARQVITGTEIDWQAVLADIRATLPAGTTVISLAFDGASPMQAYAQAGVPLQGVRIATVSFTVQSATILAGPSVVDALEAVPGFVDVQVPSAAVVEDGIAETSFVLHLDEGAYTYRYTPVETTAPAAVDTVDGTVEASATDAEEN